MGDTSSEMRRCADKIDKERVKTVDAADTVERKKGGIFARIASIGKKNPKRTAKELDELIEDFDEILQGAIKSGDFLTFVTDTKLILTQVDLRLQDMILRKKKDLESERGDEEYNRMAVAILNTMDWHFQSIGHVLGRPLTGKETKDAQVTWLELVEYHLEQVAASAEEYTKARKR